ncbi:MAG: ABC transporter ATP-binding protein [Thermoleophilia bacterium]|nr:ABC transporter ATP-binding protein [Thermoleophilia bacterium]
MKQLDDRPAARLSARGIVRSHAGVRVLDGVDLVQEQPGLVGLLGPNGAGKTTLLRIVAQLTELDSGTLEVCGRSVDRADDSQARRLVGWAPHEPLAWRSESVEHNLRYAAQLAGLDRRRARTVADAAIELWGLADVRASAVRRLSRGWAQRYSLARADLLAPPVLLLDEPTTGLDDVARGQLEDALEAWRSERVVVVASHEREWLAARSDQLLDLAAPAADRPREAVATR